jgi:hypothetical protein
MNDLEWIKIPADLNDAAGPGLFNRLKAKLSHAGPAAVGWAERIPGMTQTIRSAKLSRAATGTGSFRRQRIDPVAEKFQAERDPG